MKGSLKSALKIVNRNCLERVERTDLRLAQLRAYTYAISATLQQHVKMKALSKSELVAVLVAAALYIESLEELNDGSTTEEANSVNKEETAAS